MVAPRAVDLSAPVRGILVEQMATLGQEVATGDVVALVQAPALPEEIEAAQAALSGAKAGLKGAQLAVSQARRETHRERALVQRGASTTEAQDRAEAKLESAQAAVRERTAQVAERGADLRRLRALREAGYVRAPFPGRVGAWFEAPGSVVGPDDAVVRLTAAERLWVRFAVPSTDVDADGLAVGRAVTVHPAGGLPSATATIARIAPELDLASQMIVVEARLHPSATMRPGLAGRVLLAAPTPPEARP
ncbi:MAG: efflux RND transporter periplasmic adaptor subunit [Nannocystales bacterium]